VLLLHIIRRILFLLVVLLTLLQVTCNNEEAIVKVAEGNMLKEETINEAIIIGKEEGGLHKLKGHSEAAMTHTIEESM
jgi:hypothetical protein